MFKKLDLRNYFLLYIILNTLSLQANSCNMHDILYDGIINIPVSILITFIVILAIGLGLFFNTTGFKSFAISTIISLVSLFITTIISVALEYCTNFFNLFLWIPDIVLGLSFYLLLTGFIAWILTILIFYNRSWKELLFYTLFCIIVTSLVPAYFLLLSIIIKISESNYA